jgi:hypothetical protein
MIWVAAVILAAILVWMITIAARVRRLKAAHRRIMDTPVTRWLPPEGMKPRRATMPDFSAIDWPVLSSEVDGEGVHLIDYDAQGQRGVSGKQRNPANIAVFGIKRARAYCDSGGDADLTLALRQFDHISRSARPVRVGGKDTVLWYADFDLLYQYNAKAPWTSAYFHNYCMAAMVWANELTSDASYLDLAEKAVVAYEATTSAGGLAYPTDNDGLFFEEIVAEPLQHILNGHMTALIGLLRYAELTQSADARRICRKGVRGLLAMLPKFDRNGYSLYSVGARPSLKNHFNIANSSYHHNQIAQLRMIYHFTGEKAFDKYAQRWAKRSCGVFDVLWTCLFVIFKDVMKLAKAIVRR